MRKRKKKQGVKMKGIGDDDEGDVLGSGFGISKIPKDKVEKIKEAFEKTKN